VLLRSDNLQGLTAGDMTELVDARDVRLVVDLRTGGEVELEGPGPLVGRVEIRHRSLYPEAGHATDVAAEDALPWKERGWIDGETPAVNAYLGYLRDRPDSIVAALTDVASGAGATLVHCAAGKDRTGVVCALALAAAGVPRHAIVADYLATGERIAAIMRRLRSSATYADDLGDSPDESHRPLPATMERVFAVLDGDHGGPLGWLAQHGFDPTALRRRLT
jgi:protein-tyrosine phosphatase